MFQSKPFITPEILQQKRIRSKLETIFRKSKTPENKAKFKEQTKLVSNLVTKAKRQYRYLQKIISENKLQPKRLWSSLNCLFSEKIDHLYQILHLI